MPAKTPKPVSLVKLTPQTPSTEKNKPRKQKEKHMAESSLTGSKDYSVERNDEVNTKSLSAMHVSEKRFDLLIDGVPYIIHTIPFLWNENVCFRVHINGNEAHVFSWDEESGSLRAIDDGASILPDGVEQAIHEKIIT